jgi:hypothetical protein
LKYRDAADLRVDEFTAALSDALVLDTPPFDPRWAESYAEDRDQSGGFEQWLTTIKRQIVDLREMSAAGVFENTMRYFGVSSPRGTHWYNFDIGTYLECATAGSLGGWEPGDETGREFVSGPVAVLEPDGSISSRNAQEIKHKVIAVDRVSWARFTRILECGQWYE